MVLFAAVGHEKTSNRQPNQPPPIYCGVRRVGDNTPHRLR